MLDLLRLFSAGLVPVDRFGAQADDLALFAGLLIGQADGRPMNPSKLAQYVGIPRPSVIRKLADLERRGLVERTSGGFIMTTALSNAPEALAAAEAAARRIARAPTSLSLRHAQQPADL
ncbi:MarR family transcriptional regulator [Pseudomonas aeruginosa]|uniref:MarR family transcriptional regulator n=1 Tax=Pseudomonas aeruginosa TaxID=287 RepID=UPI0032E44C05